MSKFRVGERVRDKIDWWEGYVVKVIGWIGDKRIGEEADGTRGILKDGFYYEIEFGRPDLYIVAEQSLQKLLPDSDCYQKSTWRDFDKIIKRPEPVECGG